MPLLLRFNTSADDNLSVQTHTFPHIATWMTSQITKEHNSLMHELSVVQLQWAMLQMPDMPTKLHPQGQSHYTGACTNSQNRHAGKQVCRHWCSPYMLPQQQMRFIWCGENEPGWWNPSWCCSTPSRAADALLGDFKMKCLGRQVRGHNFQSYSRSTPKRPVRN